MQFKVAATLSTSEQIMRCVHPVVAVPEAKTRKKSTNYSHFS